MIKEMHINISIIIAGIDLNVTKKFKPNTLFQSWM